MEVRDTVYSLAGDESVGSEWSEPETSSLAFGFGLAWRSGMCCTIFPLHRVECYYTKSSHQATLISTKVRCHYF